MKNGIIANDIIVQGEEARIPIEIWKDGHMLFPTYDESVPGRNLFPLTKIEAYGGNIEKINNQGGYPAYKCTPKTPDIGNNIGIRKSVGGIDKSGNGEYTISLWCKVVNYNTVLRSYTDFYNSDTSTSQRVYSISKVIPTQEQDKWFKISSANNITAFDRISAFYVYSDFANAEAELYTTAPKIEKGNNPNPVWTPAPEELLDLSKIIPINCSYRIDGSDIVISDFTENNGHIDIEVSYGEDWIQSKRINFKKPLFQDIQVSDKNPTQVYYNKNLLLYNYHNNTQAIFDYANDRYFQLPTNRIAYDEYIRDLVKNGIFGKLDLHYLFSGDGDANFKLINVINPGTYNGTAYGGLEWSTEGVKGNGVNGYMQTGLDLSRTDIHKYQLLDAGRGAFLRPAATHYTTSVVDFGRYAPSRRNAMYQVPANNRKINSNAELTFPYPALSNRSFITHNRIERERCYALFLMGVQVYINAVADDWVMDDFIHLFRYGEYNSGYASDFTLMAYYIGLAITEQERDIWVQLYNNLLTSNNLATL